MTVSSSAWGEVVPCPVKPESKILMASVRTPDFKVEKMRLPAPPPKFCVRRPVIADVVVPLVTSLALKDRREPVEVAAEGLDR